MFTTVVDGNSALLTAKAWKTRHVSYNSWGFRDDEFEPIERFDNHVRIMLLGDSFAFGNGINNKDDLLDSRLEKALSGNTGISADVSVFNISKPGWETATELAAFENYAERIKPHIVLIQHLVNDIDDSVPFRPAQHFSLVKWIPLTDISYFLDFFIWHVYIAQQPKPADGFPKELHHYQDESVFANHAEIITDLVSAIRKQGAVPVAAVFPTWPFLRIPACSVKHWTKLSRFRGGRSNYGRHQPIYRFRRPAFRSERIRLHPNEEVLGK